MSESDNGLPSVSVQESIINAGFNSTLLYILLSGMCTIVYFGTLYIYLTSTLSRSTVVLFTVTVLWLVTVAQTAIQWQQTAQLLGLVGQPIGNSFLFIVSGPRWSTIVTDIFTFLTSSLADLLLVWRCYHIWDDSVRAILAPLVLLLAETANIIGAAAHDLNPSPSLDLTLNNIITAAIFMTFGVTLLTTLLIIYRIYSVSRRSVARSNKRAFIAVLDTIVQSSAAYAAVALLYAVDNVFEGHMASLPALVVQTYASTLFSTIAFIAPTIMVARVALVANNTERNHRTTHLSGLEFYGQSTDVDATRTLPHAVLHTVETNPVQQGEKGKQGESLAVQA